MFKPSTTPYSDVSNITFFSLLKIPRGAFVCDDGRTTHFWPRTDYCSTCRLNSPTLCESENHFLNCLLVRHAVRYRSFLHGCYGFARPCDSRK